MRTITVLLLLCLSVQLSAQTPAKRVYSITADSVKITDCDSSELIIENHTQNVPGFLFNTGRGRTIFQRGAQQLGNGMYLIGADTLHTSPNAWLQGGNSFGMTSVLGTLDSNHLDFYTGGAARARLTDTGNFIIGDTVDHGRKLQVNGASYFNGGQYFGGTVNLPNETAFSWFNPTINPIAGYESYAIGTLLTPTFNANADNQFFPALQVTPNYNMGSYGQPTDGITPAVYIASQLGGIMIDQESSYPGHTGEPLYIYQGGTSDKPAILNLRNGNATQTPFIWNNDNRPSSTLGYIIPAMYNTVTDSVLGGEGVSYALGRYDFGYEASIAMQYQNETASNINVNTSIAFNTHNAANGSITPMYINGANIGMGTNTPTAQLHTTGSVRFAGLTQDSTRNLVIVADDSGNLYYRTASSLAADGLVRSSLAVNGPINAKRVIVSPDEWADYVFDSSYKLPSLTGVETYIRKEHHLPGIPSAAEVKKDGIDVGAGQAALLKKIEELTLYNIGEEKKIAEQNQRLEAQDKALALLKAEVEELKALINKTK